ncbi:MAG: CRISPR-associated protein Cas4, partial [Pyrobaculum sp.]
MDYVKPDVVTMGTVIEFKFGPSQNLDVALAGYAMAIEAAYGAYIDYGIHVEASVDKTVEYHPPHVYHLGDEARQKFLHARDNAIRIVITKEDPGLANCYEAC